MSRHGGLSPHCRPLIAAQSQRGLLSVPTGTEFHFHPEVRVPQQPSPSAAASRPATSATKESSVVTGSARQLLSVPTGTEFHFHPEVRVPQQPSPSAAASRPATSATKESSVVTGSARQV